MKRTLEAICTGTTRPFNGAELSAFVKRPRKGLVQFLEDGLAPDEQADRKNHGGPDMAVHLYPLAHHHFWREQIGDIGLLNEPGAFGSNLAVNDLTENDVHIGDRFQIGTALLEVSQPRKPCWKIEHRFSQHCNSKGMVAKIVKTARCGWYFRVLEVGEATAGDVLERVETGHETWTIARTSFALHAGKGTSEDYFELAALEGLSVKERARAASRLD
ncbi:MOSC domain-containing protein [uncultured Erythrobacter sp.]|uniref:MOSC domain-containing protein n=1 Tax=uncultured Erythrobacter sp. TaxID=263913 RepID=UPI002612F68C|nr:MOSC domain-containing protein [uncultured Erythrobacter sp.]